MQDGSIWLWKTELGGVGWEPSDELRQYLRVVKVSHPGSILKEAQLYGFLNMPPWKPPSLCMSL